MSSLIGFKAFVTIQLTVSAIAGALGVWLFYVQHQFEGGYWERSDAWEYTNAALRGSSYYKLPRVLQWFTGNIGYHHIHHLSPRVPNYFLQTCHESQPIFRSVNPITLLTSARALTYRLWDEQRKVFVGFRAIGR
jgi:omega-6 fatty acid desaturase (delta-12 desaturase)